MKQTKKFGLHSCEPCRKFISSNIICVKNGDHLSYSCSKKGTVFVNFGRLLPDLFVNNSPGIVSGPENCLLTETIPVNDGTPRSKKDALSNMRCKACWLTMCLEKYQMPIGLRNSLVQFIAEDDRPTTFSTSDVEMSYDDVGKRFL